MKMKTLDSLWQRGKKFLGINYPIISGAKTWISDSHFVSAVSNEGAFGARTAPRTHPRVLYPSLTSFCVEIYNSLRWLDEKSRQRLRFRHQSQKGISYP